MDLEPIQKLSRDEADASRTLGPNEARFLVDAYYQMQENRMRSAAQVRALSESHEPHAILQWLATQDATLESQLRRALARYAEETPVGQWCLSNIGIGPVITAGLLAHIDIEKAPTVGHIWRFAGLDPSMKWEKKTRRPWNAALKTLCWKIGESFVKVSGNEEAYYGQVYVQRKALEQQRNEQHAFADQAKQLLADKNFGKETKARECYEKGLLPPGHIHARAKRYAVKLFLSHFHEVAYRDRFNAAPPLPYPIAFQQHAHYIPPPPGVIASDTKGTTVDERAIPDESTASAERAIDPESTIDFERAKHHESAIPYERAINRESTHAKERARADESSMPSKRAIPTDSAAGVERAAKQKRTKR